MYFNEGNVKDFFPSYFKHAATVHYWQSAVRKGEESIWFLTFNL